MRAERYLVIVNPRSGNRRGMTVLDQVRPILTRSGAKLDVQLAQSQGHAAVLAKTCDLNSYQRICIIGGDGTVHEVADGLLQRGERVDVPLAIIPAGTGNTLHQHLNLQNPLEAARRIMLGSTQSLDVIRVTMGNEVVFCIDIVGWGAVADINRTAEQLRWAGTQRYAIASLWNLLWASRRRAKLILDDETIEDEFLFAIACNAKYTGAGMKLAPHARTDDGLIDVVIVRRASRRQMLNLFARVFHGSHLELKYVEYHQVRSFGIETLAAMPLDLDGENKGQSPFSAEVIPAALQVFA
jgi:YegS/Rv2252/BmrU family lipid kinase